MCGCQGLIWLLCFNTKTIQWSCMCRYCRLKWRCVRSQGLLGSLLLKLPNNFAVPGLIQTSMRNTLWRHYDLKKVRPRCRVAVIPLQSCHTETLKAFEALPSSLSVLMLEWKAAGSFQTSKVAGNSASAASFTVQVNHFPCRKVHHTHFVWQGQKGDVLWWHVITFLSLVQTRPTCFYEATSHRGCVLFFTCFSVAL